MKNLILGILIATGTQAFAHGEDKPGPHGGQITMPGAFHVELVQAESRKLKAYLLDIDWKNPTIKDSTLGIKHASAQAKCSAAGDHFLCEFPGDVDLNKSGELTVTASREKQKGNAVKYALPLKYKEGK